MSRTMTLAPRVLPLSLVLAACAFGQEEGAQGSAAGEAVVHAAPRPLPEGAVVEDWASFLGPRRDGHVREAPLALDFGPQGPPLVWELPCGDGFSSPVVAGEHLVYMHRVGDEEVVECLDPGTGAQHWSRRTPCTYSGVYIEDGGPRATPTIVEDRVYVHGVEGLLACLDLGTGKVVWERNTTVEYGVGDDFFGVVASPLVVGDFLIQNVGSPGGPSVVAFDRHTGEVRWEAGSKWGPSCASPVLARVNGTDKLLVLAGGKSRPPTGGLMVLDPATGDVQSEYGFRSRTYESVLGATPILDGERVFLSSSYNVGSAGLRVAADGGLTELWTNRRFGLQFSSPLFRDGVLYAVDGVSGRAGSLVALDPATGEERWREDLSFSETVDDRGTEKTFTFSIGEGSVLAADGKLIVLGDTGQLVVLAPRGAGAGGAAVLARATLFHAPETWTPPVVSHGLLYVCQNRRARFGASEPRLLCYDLRGP